VRTNQGKFARINKAAPAAVPVLAAATALASLLTVLESYGLIVNSTTT